MVRTIAKDHDDKRLHILNVAAKVFSERGIARASMSEVAKACGISKANIYHYYSSKDELVFDILDSYLSELRDWICNADIAGLPPAEQFGVLTCEFLLAYDGMDHQHKIQSDGLPLLDAAKQQVLKGYQRELVAHVSQVLRACAPDSLGQDQIKCRDTTMSVFGMLNWFYMWQPNATKEARINYAASVVDLTLNGVAS